MATSRLENARWGFESNCFVCEPRNPAGLGIAFEHDDETDVVRAQFTLDDRFSGAPTYVHGGVVLAILDEAMSWATIAVGRVFAVTGETSTRFLRPVRVGRDHVVEARVDEAADDRLTTSATVLDAKGRSCAEARATFVPLGPAQAVDALGVVPTGEDARYVRGGGSGEEG
jgi:uncharacterized protein (TIGR00369 family)